MIELVTVRKPVIAYVVPKCMKTAFAFQHLMNTQASEYFYNCKWVALDTRALDSLLSCYTAPLCLMKPVRVMPLSQNMVQPQGDFVSLKIYFSTM